MVPRSALGEPIVEPWSTPAVLVIDDDDGTRETVDWALRSVGLKVVTASSGAEGLALAGTQAFQLILIDLRLGDMLGTEVVRALRDDSALRPFVLISGFLTTSITVDAMRLGAVSVVEKPVDIDSLLGIVRAAVVEPRDASANRPLEPSSAQSRPAIPSVAEPKRPGSAVERWVMLVVKACESDRDLRTLRDWATCVGVSYSSLRESCLLAGVRAHDARDLARLLRVVINARHFGCDPTLLLDVNDERTLESLLERAGFQRSDGLPVSVDEFLKFQRFIPAATVNVQMLRTRLAERVASTTLRQPSSAFSEATPRC